MEYQHDLPLRDCAENYCSHLCARFEATNATIYRRRSCAITLSCRHRRLWSAFSDDFRSASGPNLALHTSRWLAQLFTIYSETIKIDLIDSIGSVCYKARNAIEATLVLLLPQEARHPPSQCMLANFQIRQSPSQAYTIPLFPFIVQEYGSPMPLCSANVFYATRPLPPLYTLHLNTLTVFSSRSSYVVYLGDFSILL